MAYLLAPYNSAMRLGMGFNSFTQQLCINDAVKTKDNQTATEKNLTRPQYKKARLSTWSAKFVDRISEVTDSLNISGSLEIKCDAIGGGGGASAHFIDSNKFKESDLNYFIQVKVTNQQLVADDVTEFSPIANVSDADFTRVYGDSFISGFIEGGKFNALVSIKLKDRSKAKEIGGQLKIDLDLKAASVHGQAEGGKKDLESTYEGETTISRCVDCAILTKYTRLEELPRETLKGSPLGVYSSALLDAYMDFKVMWRNIQMESQALALIVPATPSEEKTENGGSDVDAAPKQVIKVQVCEPVEAPLPPNVLTPYPANIFGLDKARRDCRFEMIKIVKEVDAVAQDPKVAIDPSRTWQYISPAIFRLLLPSVHNVDAEKAAAAASEEEHLAAENLAKTNRAVQDELTETRLKLANTEAILPRHRNS
ncbi:hypothetical protein B0H13DRAFT_2238801 [Mycena leptocephala]|nr:hypothetical protein B0H13DRAFT_2238801 [Mycena leptocephala]